MPDYTFTPIVPRGVQGPAPAAGLPLSSGSPSVDYLKGLGSSALSGMTELVGITLPEAEEFRQDHPLAGFASQWASAAVPYAGWFRAAKAIKGFEKAVSLIGDLEKAPFITGAAREAARLAPFEFARLGASQVVGDQSFPDMASSVALDLGLSAGIGGLLHGLSAGGTRVPKVSLPGLDISAPAPLQLRKMKQLVAEGNLTPEQMASANARIKKFDIISRAETPERGKYVFGISNNDALTRQVNALFNTSSKTTTTVVNRRRFIAAQDTDKFSAFPSEAGWKEAAAAAGLPEDFPTLGQYYRHVSFRPTGRTTAVADQVVQAFNDLQSGKITAEDYNKLTERLVSKDYATGRARAIHRLLTTGFESVGNNWYMGKEDRGLFILAKRIPGFTKPVDTSLLHKGFYDTRGQGALFHGGGADFAVDEGHYATMNIYGQGLYTTDAFDISHGYAVKKNKGSVRQIGPQDKNIKLLDMTQTVPSWLDDSSDLTAFAKDEIGENGTIQQLYDEIRSLSAGEGYTAHDVQEIFEVFREQATEQGFRGLTHVGGTRTGTKPHKVSIFWYPEDVKISESIKPEKFKPKPEDGSAEDQWVIFKTDNPAPFLPSNSRWANNVLEQSSWHLNAKTLADGGLQYNNLRDFMEKFPLHNVEELKQPGRLAKLIPKNLKGPSSEFAARVSEGAREYLAPTVAQLRKSPLGNYILQAARFAYDDADTMAHEVVFGRQAVSNRNLFRQAFSEGKIEPNTDSIKAILEPLQDGSPEMEELRRLWSEGIDPARYGELVQSGDISQQAADVGLRLAQINSFVTDQIDKLSTALGETPKKWAKGHLGLSRSWEGDTRIALSDASGEIKAVIGGPTRRAAQNNAKKALAKWTDLTQTGDYSISQAAELPPDLKVTFGNPGFMHERRGLRGFKWDLEPWTKKELLDAYKESMAARYRHIADKSVEDLLSQRKAQLAAHDPASSRIVEARINDLAGVQAPASLWQNRIADRLLAPMIGNNSATKIVGITNTAQFAWNLGMGNIAFPVTSALTFIQTVLPEVAMILGATERDLTNYTHFAAGGTRGIVGGGAMLSPGKLMASSMKEMFRPRKELQEFIRRAGADGTVAPRLAEDYVGESATKVTDLRQAISSGKGFAQWLLALSSFLPANAEKLSRVHSFTVGYILARDILRIADEDAAYMLAKQFTDKTMYLYSAADRPRIFTTPAGSALGLFKTWQMNYMASMLEYSGQAVKGNWAPLAWQTAGTAALGGVAATPLYWVADGFSRAFLGGSLLQKTYDNMDQTAGDAFMYGMPAALTGISLYSQTASPLANPQRDASMLWSLVLLNRAQALSKGAGLAFDNWQATGKHPGASAAVRDQLFRALAPSSVARVVSAFSGEDMIRSLSSGYPMIDQVPLSDRIAYAMKLNPVELDKAMAVSSELYADQAKAKAEIAKLGRAFAEAADNHDSHMMNLIINQATIWGLDAGAVIHSYQRREKLADQPQMETTFSAVKREKFKNVLQP